MLTLVVNPIAGNGLAQRTHERVRALLESRGIEYRSFVTQAPGDAEALCWAGTERSTKWSTAWR